jgi:aldehyde:ferredoxin oxidoreductase
MVEHLKLIWLKTIKEEKNEEKDLQQFIGSRGMAQDFLVWEDPKVEPLRPKTSEF